MGFNLSEESKPTTPSTGNVRLYNKNDELYVVKDDGSEEAVITGSPPSGNFTVTAKTSNYTILASEADDYTIFTNSGATSDISFQLPLATAGLRVYICNVSDTYSIDISAGAGDVIKKNGMSFDKIYGNYQHEVITCTAINSTDWFVEYTNKPTNVNIGNLGGINNTNIGFLDVNKYYWAFGSAGRGLLLLSGNSNYFEPLQYTGLKFDQLIYGAEYLIAIDDSGQAWSWGYAYYGATGNGRYFNIDSTPLQICGGHTFCEIDCGYDNHTLAIDNNGQAWSWGYNRYGRLGTNNKTNYTTPVQVCGGHTFCKVSCGVDQTAAIDNNGQAWVWGKNNYGELGDNAVVSKSTPVAVCGGHTFCEISAGLYFTVAIDNNGQAWCWGSNFYGKLGDNTNTSKRTPVAVCGGHTFCSIHSGESHTVALDENGQAWSWGYNSYGQLGDNTNTSRNTPVAVCGDYTFCKITVYRNSTMGFDSSNQLWYWGQSDSNYDNNGGVLYRTPYLLNKIF